MIRLVVAQSKPGITGRYADAARYVNTDAGVYHFPAPMEVPALMHDFATWLQRAGNSPAVAFEARRRLVGIHPFNDGNGRTARLLMNLALIRAGYPPIAVRPEDRPAYIRHGGTTSRGAHPPSGGWWQPWSAVKGKARRGAHPRPGGWWPTDQGLLSRFLRAPSDRQAQQLTPCF